MEKMKKQQHLTPAPQSACPAPADLDDIPLMMTVEEFGRFLRISRNTAYECVRSGQIPSVKVGRQIRIYRNDVLDLRRKAEATGSSTADLEALLSAS